MEEKSRSEKLWGGRFSEATDQLVEDFTVSVQFDSRLWREDIEGSKAHAAMLARQGIISEEDRRAIFEGLDEIAREIEEGRFQWRKELEDVHMNIEHALTQRIGEAGKRLHTARSRNDQVATDIRLHLKRAATRLDGLLFRLQSSFVRQAEENGEIIMPGYTHLQRAQPVLWGHHMLAYFEMFKRDRQRLWSCLSRIDSCPLGSAALAGTGFPIDRRATAQALGFSQVAPNSMDAVSDRDFAMEFAAVGAIIMVHLSRLAEEVILWTTTEFGFVELPDRFCTGSSIMPQKKNPDVMELIRGKSARVIGDLVSLLTLLKGLPLTYNRDLQEDKEPLFDCIDTVTASVEIAAALVGEMAPRREVIEGGLRGGFLTATDLADYLVRKGVPFREAHSIVGRAVAEASRKGKELYELTLDELRTFSDLIEEDVYDLLSHRGSVSSRRSEGGTGYEPFRASLEAAKTWLKEHGEGGVRCE